MVRTFCGFLTTPLTSSSSTCNVWFDIARTTLPRPFRMPPVEDVFRTMRAERKWFKNVRLFPSELPSIPLVADQMCNFFKGSCDSAHSAKPFAKNENSTSLPSTSRVDYPLLDKVIVSQQTAKQVIDTIADIVGLSVSELLDVNASQGGLDSLGIDSLLSLAILSKLTLIGIPVPQASISNGFLLQENFETFLESLIMKCSEVSDVV